MWIPLEKTAEGIEENAKMIMEIGGPRNRET